MTEIIQSSLFDYSQLDAETRITIKQRAERIQERNRTIALNIWENGRDLYEAQQQLAQHGYGCFIEWAESETGFSIRTVYNFIAVYQNFDCATVAQSKLTAKVLYLLAAPSTPEPARIEAIERAQAGESITHKTAQGIVNGYKPAPSLLPAPIKLQPIPAGEIVRTEVRFVPAKPFSETEYEEMAEELAEDEDGYEWTEEEPQSAPVTNHKNGHANGNGHTFVAPVAPNHMAIHYSSETPEHYTPKEIIEAAISVLGAIDLDPCSNSKDTPNVPALEHFTIADDGLSLPWFGRVYMNPPYGRVIGDWTQKLAGEYQAGNVTEAIALVPGRIDTQWWQSLGLRYPACFYTGRLVFIGNNDPAPFPSTIFYLGEDIAKFYEVFSAIGQIWTRIDEHWFTS